MAGGSRQGGRGEEGGREGEQLPLGGVAWEVTGRYLSMTTTTSTPSTLLLSHVYTQPQLLLVVVDVANKLRYMTRVYFQLDGCNRNSVLPCY